MIRYPYDPSPTCELAALGGLLMCKDGLHRFNNNIDATPRTYECLSIYISFKPESLKQIGDYDFQKVARMTHFETDVAASNDLQQRTKPHKDGDGGNGSSNSKKTEMTNHMC